MGVLLGLRRRWCRARTVFGCELSVRTICASILSRTDGFYAKTLRTTRRVSRVPCGGPCKSQYLREGALDAGPAFAIGEGDYLVSLVDDGVTVGDEDFSVRSLDGDEDGLLG